MLKKFLIWLRPIHKAGRNNWPSQIIKRPSPPKPIIKRK